MLSLQRVITESPWNTNQWWSPSRKQVSPNYLNVARSYKMYQKAMLFVAMLCISLVIPIMPCSFLASLNQEGVSCSASQQKRVVTVTAVRVTFWPKLSAHSLPARSTLLSSPITAHARHRSVIRHQVPRPWRHSVTLELQGLVILKIIAKTFGSGVWNVQFRFPDWQIDIMINI